MHVLVWYNLACLMNTITIDDVVPTRTKPQSAAVVMSCNESRTTAGMAPLFGQDIAGRIQLRQQRQGQCKRTKTLTWSMEPISSADTDTSFLRGFVSPGLFQPARILMSRVVWLEGKELQAKSQGSSSANHPPYLLDRNKPQSQTTSNHTFDFHSLMDLLRSGECQGAWSVILRGLWRDASTVRRYQTMWSHRNLVTKIYKCRLLEAQ